MDGNLTGCTVRPTRRVIGRGEFAPTVGQSLVKLKEQPGRQVPLLRYARRVGACLGATRRLDEVSQMEGRYAGFRPRTFCHVRD